MNFSFQGNSVKVVRALVPFLFLTAVLATGACAAAADTMPHEWTQFRMGADNNAVIAGDVSTTWHIDTHGQISASPSLVDGTLYIGNNEGRLYSINAASGRTNWVFHVNNPIMTAPLVYEDLVIVGEGDATSQSNMPNEPLVVGQGPSALLAFDRETGTMRWRVQLAGSAMPTPAIINGVLVHHDGAGWVSGYDPLTGHKLFAHHLKSVASMSAILPQGPTDFITAGVGLNAAVRMNARTGAVVWQSAFPWGDSGLGDCPMASNGSMVFCDYVSPVSAKTTQVGSPATEHVFALDVARGGQVWNDSLETGTLPPRNEAAIPLVNSGLVFVGSSMVPAMHALDPATGRHVWTVRTRGPVKGGLVAVDGIVYFGDFGGYLWAIQARSGKVVGKKNMHAPFNVGSPLVDGRTLIVGSDGGTVFAVPLAAIRAAHDV
jgi:outer membrane protein assembly factor BamB